MSDRSGFSSGVSSVEDSYLAAEEAVLEASERIEPEPKLAVVFCGPDHDTDRIVQAVTDKYPDISVIGATSAGEFTEKEVTENGVVVALIQSVCTVDTAISDNISNNLNESMDETVNQLPDPSDIEGEYKAVINFHNGLAGKGEQITLLTRQFFPEVPVTGGSAGDNLRLEETKVFTNDGTATDGIALALISSNKPFGLASKHGHHPLSGTYDVTRSDENVLYELDGEPAFEVWKDEIRDLVQEIYGVDIDSVDPDDELFDKLLNEFELGIKIDEDEYKIRWPAMTDTTNGELKFATGIPEGSVVRVMHSPPDSQVESARDAARMAKSSFDKEYAISGGLIFDCVCRGLLLGEDFDKAVQSLRDELQTSFAGLQTYGEVCMSETELGGYHNTTTAVFLLPE